MARTQVIHPFDQRAAGRRGGASAHPPSRRGSAISSVLIALLVAGALAVTTWIARPAYLHAGATPLEAVTARSERHQEIIELIASMISSSVGVAAIYPRGVTPYAEIVLRIAGDGETVEPHEIALLSHSRLLQAVTLYTHGEVEESFTQTDLHDRGFPDRWRGDPHVKPRLLAAGLSDMHVKVVEPGMLRIALTWAADSADGEDEAIVYVSCQLSGNSKQQ